MYKKVLVTNASGTLGTSIVRVLKKCFDRHKIEVHAIANTLKSSVKYFADVTYEYSENSLLYQKDKTLSQQIIKLCRLYKIDAIIPLTDYETVILAKYSTDLPFLFSSSLAISNACYDKWKYFHLCKKLGIKTPKTWLPSMYNGELKYYLIKLRTGGLSKEIFFNNPCIDRFNDDYLVQEKLEGKEVTIAIYKDLSGKLWRPFVGERELLNGMTSYLKAIDKNKGIMETIEKFTSIEGFQGPCNIQGLIQGDNFTAFEINLRFSGSTSLRHLLGFKDLEWAINDWLGKMNDEDPCTYTTMSKKIGVRYFADLCMDEEDFWR